MNRPNQAGALECPNCGAAVASIDEPNCSHCGTKLATLNCSVCLKMIFRGLAFCPFCGNAAVDLPPAIPSDTPCPRCQGRLGRVQTGAYEVQQCGECRGLWVDSALFDRICVEQEKQTAFSALFPIQTRGNESIEAVRYLRCPACREIMNRINFGDDSGVILDVCKGHGVWFDQSELAKIIAFIRNGGLEHSRMRQQEKRAEEQRRASRHSSEGEVFLDRLDPDNSAPLGNHPLSALLNGAVHFAAEVIQNLPRR